VCVCVSQCVLRAYAVDHADYEVLLSFACN